MSFTPGPWPIERRKTSITSIGPCVADEYAGMAWLDLKECDARLIAAAPELLEALEAIHGNCDLPDEYGMMIERVIAKARGED